MITTEWLKRKARVVAFSTVFSSYACFVYIYLTAWFSESKSTVVYINKFGEAGLELFIVLFTIPMIVWYCYHLRSELD